jgi:hypothetical protein
VNPTQDAREPAGGMTTPWSYGEICHMGSDGVKA